MQAWGPLDWLLGKIQVQAAETTILGTVGFEDRCHEAPRIAHAHGVRKMWMLDIADIPSRHGDLCKTKRDANKAKMASSGFPIQFASTNLLATGDEIKAIFNNVLKTGGNGAPIDLWIDISCLPKRFFFLLTKLAYKSPLVRSLVVTYTQPAPGRYTEQRLAEDPESAKPLPGFSLLPKPSDLLVIGVGFEALGLPQLLSEYNDRKHDFLLLIPFPPGQPYSMRIWESIIALNQRGDGDTVHRIAALDAFGAYQLLRRCRDIPETITRHVTLAPYGPKPMSLGMCLYAIETDSAVMYTQPRTYHPDYSFGIGPAWGYCLRSSGVKTF